MMPCLMENYAVGIRRICPNLPKQFLTNWPKGMVWILRLLVDTREDNQLVLSPILKSRCCNMNINLNIFWFNFNDDFEIQGTIFLLSRFFLHTKIVDGMGNYLWCYHLRILTTSNFSVHSNVRSKFLEILVAAILSSVEIHCNIYKDDM